MGNIGARRSDLQAAGTVLLCYEREDAAEEVHAMFDLARDTDKGLSPGVMCKLLRDMGLPATLSYHQDPKKLGVLEDAWQAGYVVMLRINISSEMSTPAWCIAHPTGDRGVALMGVHPDTIEFPRGVPFEELFTGEAIIIQEEMPVPIPEGLIVIRL